MRSIFQQEQVLGLNSAAAEASPCETGEARQEGALVWERCRSFPNRVACECTSSLLLEQFKIGLSEVQIALFLIILN